MPRQPAPRKWREWYVTESGGKGIHKLCLISDGLRLAKEKLKQWLAQCKKEKFEEAQSGLAESDTPYTIRQLAGEFMTFKKVNKKSATLEFYQKNLKRFVKWYGEIEARKLQFSHATDYIQRLQEDGLGPTTINHHLRSAKAVINYGVESDILIKNRWKKVPKQVNRERKRIVTDAEFESLLKACEKCIAFRGLISRKACVQTMQDILRILRFSGMRPGELRNLRWDHIIYDDKLIVIPASEHKTGTTAKNPEDRLIPILDEAVTILKRRQEMYGNQPLVFPTIVGKKWASDLFSQRFGRLRKWAGLDEPDHNGEKIVAYSLRHTRLTEAGTKENWPMFTLMRYAGHTNTQMTKRYVHTSKEDLVRAAQEGEKKLAEFKNPHLPK